MPALRPERPTYDTAHDALTAALLALDEIDVRHELTRVNFGRFASDTDRPGGFFFTIAVTYSVGNTVGCIGDTMTDREHAATTRRLDMVTRRFTEFVREQAVRDERAALGATTGPTVAS